MVTIVQSVWLEESEKSVKKREDIERKNDELALDLPVPSPILLLFSKEVKVDLSLVVSIDSETIILGEKEYTLPVISLINGEIYTLNEDINELNKVILAAKKQSAELKTIDHPRPIKTTP